MLDGSQRLSLSEKQQVMGDKIEQALKEFDYTLLLAEDLNKPLPFQANILTLYREPGQYLFMDAFFYWED
ncbi:hypothetical protein [Bacillus kwashiorkori]|uniref:hypothetical protein n=1 Tax=Bacillus kwashiorkori TaxID=1522318 RepID=UPI000784F741|nr:hypothetical protein [Bacillus kwashiorkori]